MKTQIVASTCALIISAYGITPAVAESFNDRGLDWTMSSPMPSAAHASPSRTSSPSDGSFASSWNKGSKRVPAQYGGSPSSPDHFATGRSCEPTPRFGFNQGNAFSTC